MTEPEDMAKPEIEARPGIEAKPRQAEPALPFVSVAVRSYRRLPQLVELVSQLQQQDYPRFEIVVIEQSTLERVAHRAALSALARDSRVRLLEYDALGAGAARNEAARQSRGDIVLFLDDDDLPLHRNWISAHAANYTDPNCIAVSGRHVVDENIEIGRAHV